MPAFAHDPRQSAVDSSKLIADVCDRIISMLQKGVAPWRKPWRAEMPQNLISRRPYGGVNYFLLVNAGFGSPYWVTEAQIVKLGGQLGEGKDCLPTLIVFCLPPRIVRTPPGRGDNRPATFKLVHRLGCHLVYNTEQVEGLDHILERRSMNRRARLDGPESILNNMPDPPTVTHNYERAWFLADLDLVSVPGIDLHNTPEDYYCTLFHELVHSTAMPHRLNRGNALELPPEHRYSQEELVAEMGSAMLCTFAGIGQQTIESSSAYVANWLSALEGDPRMLYFAAMQAGKAFNYITNQSSAKRPTTADEMKAA